MSYMWLACIACKSHDRTCSYLPKACPRVWALAYRPCVQIPTPSTDSSEVFLGFRMFWVGGW